MYTSKHFKARPEAEVFADINAFMPYKHSIRRVFLADGDPLVLSTNKLLRILQKLKDTFPKLNRVSTYASPSNLKNKTIEELRELKSAGLNLLYIGIESGDDTVLKLANKGESFSSTVSAIQKANQAEINSSVMIITGLGGKDLSRQHAINSAKLLNEIQVKYASTLVLSAYKGMDHLSERFGGIFNPLSQLEIIEEMQLFIEQLELKETIFRSDHASNYLALKGVLGRDKAQFLNQIGFILKPENQHLLRPEHLRGF
jgi:radical SAM superfamily enzyme YgiQ (UPF0313 family)